MPDPASPGRQLSAKKVVRICAQPFLVLVDLVVLLAVVWFNLVWTVYSWYRERRGKPLSDMPPPLAVTMSKFEPRLWRWLGLRTLVRLVLYYPLLALVVGVVFALAFGGMSGFDVFHLVWNDDWVVGLGNGIAVTLILGLVFLALRLLDHERLGERYLRELATACTEAGENNAQAAIRKQIGSAELNLKKYRRSTVFRKLMGKEGESNPAATRTEPPDDDATEDTAPADWAPMVKNPYLKWPKTWQYWHAWWVLLIVIALGPIACSHEQFSAEYPLGDTAESLAAGLDAKTRRQALLAALWFPVGVVAAGIGFSVLTKLGGRSDPLVGALVLAIGFTVVYVALVGVHWMVSYEWSWRVRNLLPASWSAFLLLGFLASMAWLIHEWSRHVLLHLAVVAVLVLFLQSYFQARHHLPGIDPSAYDNPVNLEAYPRLRLEKTELADDTEALQKWNTRIRESYGAPRPVVVVSVSGGATASALYTAEVLFTLEIESPGFSDQVRLITGASGGMLGAAYYVAQFRPDAPSRLYKAREEYAKKYKAWRVQPGDATRAALASEKKTYTGLVEAARTTAREQLGKDFLSPLLQHWVHKDIPLSWIPCPTTNDRGLALEMAWREYLGGVLETPFKEYRGDEQEGRIPSIVFTPMMIEDGRQLIISNLNLDYMVDTVIPSDGANPRPPEAISKSFGGVEFYRLFPDADKFKIATAVRLNASFPILSPAPALPTKPRRHIVDAGYYDNYGTLTATKWATRHVKTLADLWGGLADRPTPAVYLVQVRCFAFESSSRQFILEPEQQHMEKTGRFEDDEPGAFTYLVPLRGVVSSRLSNMVYRGDERVDALQVYAHQRTAGRVRIDRVLYECEFSPSLNWVLTDATRKLLQRAGGEQIEAEFRHVRDNTGPPQVCDNPQAEARRGRESLYRDLLRYQPPATPKQ